MMLLSAGIGRPMQYSNNCNEALRGLSPHTNPHMNMRFNPKKGDADKCKATLKMHCFAGVVEVPNNWKIKSWHVSCTEGSKRDRQPLSVTAQPTTHNEPKKDSKNLDSRRNGMQEDTNA